MERSAQHLTKEHPMTRRFPNLTAALKRAGNRYLEFMVYTDPYGTIYCATSMDMAYIVPVDIPPTQEHDPALTPEETVPRGLGTRDALAVA
jgi:hypothetical protein